MTEKVFKQTLFDASISKESIESAVKYFAAHENEKLLNLLRRERSKKLEVVHNDEKKLNIIDYLLNVLNKEGIK